METLWRFFEQWNLSKYQLKIKNLISVRTINIAECNCEKCDFMNCPKHNYCVEMERYCYSIDEFLEQFGDKLISANSVKDFLITDYQANELADCFPKFPKNTFWDIQGDSIRIVKQGPAGRFFSFACKNHLV